LRDGAARPIRKGSGPAPLPCTSAVRGGASLALQRHLRGSSGIMLRLVVDLVAGELDRV